MVGIFPVKVCCVLLSLGVGASCFTLKVHSRPNRPIQAHAFIQDHNSLSQEGASSAKQRSSVFDNAGANSSLPDMSCIPSDGDWGSNTETMRASNEESMEVCFATCRAESQCSHFTYNGITNMCFLKARAPIFYKYPGDITGSASCDTSCFERDVVFIAQPIEEFPMQGRNPTDCQAACFGTESCRAFVWLDSHCALFGAGFSASKQEYAGAIAGPRDFCDRGGNLKLAEVSDGGGSSQSQDGTRLDMSCVPSGDDWGSSTESMRVFNAESTETCFAACREEAQCSHFTYNTITKLCFLKAQAPTFYKHPGDETGSASCDTSCFEHDVAYSAQHIRQVSMPGRSPTDCQAACFGTDSCRAFVWYEAQCVLFGAGFSASKQEYAGAIAGPRDFCDRGGNLKLAEVSDGGGSSQSQDGTRLDMSCVPSGDDWGSSTESMRAFNAESTETCFAACREEAQCSHFTYNTITKLCFLKAQAPTFYKHPGDETGSASCDTSCFEHDVAYSAQHIRQVSMPGRSPTDCQAACFGTDSCRAFVWYEAQCVLFGAGFSASKQEYAGAIAGPRDFCDRGGNLKLAEVSDGGGSSQSQDGTRLDMSCVPSGDDWGSSTESMRAFNAESTETCFAACREEAQCSHFTYNTITKLCFLKAQAPTFYKHPGDETGSASCDTSCFEHDVAYSAQHIRQVSMPGRSPTDCQAACFGTDSCRAFVWYEAQCVLFGAGFSASKQEYAGAIAGPRDFCDRGGNLKLAEVSDGGGNSQSQDGTRLDMSCVPSGDDWGSSTESMRAFNAESTETCFAACREEAQCSHFTYNTITKLCFLKAQAPTFYKHPGDETGSASCDTSCFEHDVAYSAQHIRQVSMPGRSPTDCQAACFGTDSCRAFVWYEAQCVLFGAGFSASKQEYAGAIAGPRDFCDRGGNLKLAEVSDGGGSSQSQDGTRLDMSCVPSGDDWGSSTESMRVFNAESTETCFAACREEAQCSHFTYNTITKLCFLKAQAPTFYKHPGDETGSASCDTSCFEHDVAYSAQHIRQVSMPGRSPTDCQAACFGTDSCRAFVWYEAQCVLFGAGFSASKQEYAGAIAGPRDFCDRGGNLKLAEVSDGGGSSQSQDGIPLDTSCIPSGGDWGSNTETLRASNEESMEVCFATCRAESQCSHFTYNGTTNMCFLKARAPIFYKYPGDITGPASCDTSCFEHDVMFTAQPIQHVSMPGRSPTDCQAACFGTDSCRVFVWYEAQCVLFGAGFSASKQEQAGAIAGPRDFCDRGGNLKLAEVSDGGGSSQSQDGTRLDMSCVPSGDDWGSSTESMRAFNAESTETCFAACREEAQCSHFTYNTITKLCFLKAQAPTFYKHPGDETGSASCDTSCFEHGVVFVAEPIQEFSMPGRSPTDCQAACFGTESCRAFAWYDAQCALFGAGFSASKQEQAGATAGPRDFCDRGGNLTLAELGDGGGNEKCIKAPNIGSNSHTLKTVQAAFVADCMNACSETSGCSHFTYAGRTKACYLKQGEPHYEHQVGSVTGSPDCDVDYVDEAWEDAQGTLS